MGKRIDRLAGTAMMALVLYIFFIQVFESIPAACGMTLLCGIYLRQLFKGRHLGRRLSTLQAQQLLNQWAFGPDEDTKAAIAGLFQESSTESLIYLPRHPSVLLSTSDIFNTWKAHRGEKSIRIAAVCYADARARAFAGTLREPSVEIIDAARLIPKIRKSELQAPAMPKGSLLLQRLKELLTAMPGRRPGYRNALLGAGMFGIYWITNNPLYLFLSMGTLFLAGAALRLRQF